jgi:hypothetical protein
MLTLELEENVGGIIKMKHEDYHKERVKLQTLQAKLQFAQILIQAITLISTLILLGHKL